MTINDKQEKNKLDEVTTLPSTDRSLSPKERGWVNELQAALESLPYAHKISDLEVAAHAIVSKGNVTVALKRIARLVTFQQAHNISHPTTVFQAMQWLHKFFHAYPGFVQAVGKDQYGRHILVFQLSKLGGISFNFNEDDRFTALYYIFHALQPDLDSIRSGTIWVGDLEGLSRAFVTMSLFQGCRNLCKDAYPIKVKDFPVVAAPSMLSPVNIMCWPIFSRKLKRRYVSCTPKQLKKHLPQSLLPYRLGGTMKETLILELLEENLKRRFDNQENFRI